jgi:hypothetical protein
LTGSAVLVAVVVGVAHKLIAGDRGP